VLLGVIWAYAYALVGLLRPGAFSGPVNPSDGPRALFYFSFVTLATLGYGDVLPVHPAARSLATLEAVTGTPVREEVRWQKWAGDGVPELVRAKHVSREVVDKDSDGNPEYATKARAGRTTIDRDSDGNPEYRRAHRDAVELFDRDDDGRWDAAHVTRAGYEVIDRDDDGTPEYEHKWSYDDWFYHGVPDRVLRAYDEDAEEDEGASEMPPMETLGL